MTIKLVGLNLFIPCSKKLTVKNVILYSDFNVLNHLYEESLKIPTEFILYPDSTAVYFILKYFYKKKIIKLVSTDLQERLLMQSIQQNKKIFFFGDSVIVLTKMEKLLKEKHPTIKICGRSSGYAFNNEDVLDEINNSHPDILFVGLGVGRQEKWIFENYQKLNAGIIISVGGWFQYLSGMKKRAPVWLRQMHLEWLFKLIKEFSRVGKRYIIGVLKFFYRVLLGKINLELNTDDE